MLLARTMKEWTSMKHLSALRRRQVELDQGRTVSNHKTPRLLYRMFQGVPAAVLRKFWSCVFFLSNTKKCSVGKSFTVDRLIEWARSKLTQLPLFYLSFSFDYNLFLVFGYYIGPFYSQYLGSESEKKTLPNTSMSQCKKYFTLQKFCSHVSVHLHQYR